MKMNNRDVGHTKFEKLVLDCLLMAVALLSSLLEFAWDYGDKLGKSCVIKLYIATEIRK